MVNGAAPGQPVETLDRRPPDVEQPDQAIDTSGVDSDASLQADDMWAEHGVIDRLVKPSHDLPFIAEPCLYHETSKQLSIGMRFGRGFQECAELLPRPVEIRVRGGIATTKHERLSLVRTEQPLSIALQLLWLGGHSHAECPCAGRGHLVRMHGFAARRIVPSPSWPHDVRIKEIVQ